MFLHNADTHGQVQNRPVADLSVPKCSFMACCGCIQKNHVWSGHGMGSLVLESGVQGLCPPGLEQDPSPLSLSEPWLPHMLTSNLGVICWSRILHLDEVLRPKSGGVSITLGKPLVHPQRYEHRSPCGRSLHSLGVCLSQPTFLPAFGQMAPSLVTPD